MEQQVKTNGEFKTRSFLFVENEIFDKDWVKEVELEPGKYYYRFKIDVQEDSNPITTYYTFIKKDNEIGIDTEEKSEEIVNGGIIETFNVLLVY